jgi:PAS domain S-box-containing protein
MPPRVAPIDSANQVLRASESRYRRLFETARDGILLLNAVTAQIEDVNPFLEELLGYSHAEFLGRKLWEVGAFADIAQSKEMFAALQDVGYVRYADLPLKTRSGKKIAVEFVSNSYECDGVKVIQCNIRDMTAQHAATRVLHEFQAIVDASEDAIISKTLDGVIRSWNPGAATLFGFTEAEAVGKTMDLIVPADRQAEEAQILRRLKRGDHIEHFETVRRHKDGHMLHVSVTISPIRDGRNVVVGASKIARDITERKLAEAARTSLESQLRESQKMEAIGTLAGGIAHDFNNVIATILGNVDLAIEDTEGNAAARGSLYEIRKASQRARDLVQQILTFSRRQPLERARIRLGPVVEDAVRLMRATFPAKVQIVLQHADAVPEVLADATQIQQVLLNLATNSMHAAHGGHQRIEVTLDAATVDEHLARLTPALTPLCQGGPTVYARISVRDSGPGMEDAVLERIFEPFFTTKALGEGTGLGLSVVRGIVQRHQGIILVRSTPADGTTFSIYLPLAPPHERELPLPVPPRLAAPVSSSEKGCRLLYIDDDESLLFLVRRLLERHGYEVTGFVDARKAIEHLRAEPYAFDVVVTDYNMPYLSGLDVARAIRNIRADLPVAIVSGFVDEQLLGLAQEAGVRQVLVKATDVAEFIASVRSLTRRET